MPDTLEFNSFFHFFLPFSFIYFVFTLSSLSVLHHDLGLSVPVCE